MRYDPDVMRLQAWAERLVYGGLVAALAVAALVAVANLEAIVDRLGRAVAQALLRVVAP